MTYSWEILNYWPTSDIRASKMVDENKKRIDLKLREVWSYNWFSAIQNDYFVTIFKTI